MVDWKTILKDVDDMRLTREEVASAIGVSRPTLNKLISGNTDITINQAKALGEFLHYTKAHFKEVFGVG